MDKTKLKTLFFLHLLLMLYSTSGIFSKLASQQDFLSLPFCVYYGCIIGLLGIYAIGWQQVIKRLPLGVAFANKAVTVLWGIVWGALFFHEAVTLGKIAGAGIVCVGVMLYVTADKLEDKGDEE